MSGNDDVSELEEELTFNASSGWLADIDEDELESLIDTYKTFLASCKTEREAADWIVDYLEDEGFVALSELDEYEEGAKVYAVSRGKLVVAARLGDDLENIRMTGSHIDSPRLDVKQQPLYEDADLSLLDTHYYGGIKKYQWLNVPLALHGVIVDADGHEQEIVIGEDTDDPVVVVPDLLPHLSRDQLKKELKDAVEGEDLNIVVGNMPVESDDIEEAVKLSVLKFLHEEYGLTEQDFVSAEIEAVPALEPRDAGLDRSMVAAYGQDDRSLSFMTLQAFCEADPDETVMTLFVDKEEIGSEGDTSAQSHLIEQFVSTLVDLNGSTSQSAVDEVFASMDVLSTDVAPAVNPTHKEVHDSKNAINLGQGVALVKFTGSGGKYAANDAHAEFVGEVRQLLEAHDIPWYPSELGKVDEGGGGTIAKYFARRGSRVVDLGIPVLSMHSPYELTSKADIYHGYEVCKAFFDGD